MLTPQADLAEASARDDLPSPRALLARGCALARAGQLAAALADLDAARREVVRLTDLERAALFTTSIDCRLARGELTAATADGEELDALRRLGYQLLGDRPDMILLDVMLPEQDGFAVCQQLREQGVTTPILMLTARGDDTDRIQGLRIGADDYLPKPFNPHELLARVEAVLRRVPPAESPQNGLDPDARTLRLEGREFPLTPTEYKLLETLTANPGRAYTRRQLLDRVWGEDHDGDPRTVDVHVRWLRSKIERQPAAPIHLVTVRGVGYRLDPVAH